METKRVSASMKLAFSRIAANAHKQTSGQQGISFKVRQCVIVVAGVLASGNADG